MNISRTALAMNIPLLLCGLFYAAVLSKDSDLDGPVDGPSANGMLSVNSERSSDALVEPVFTFEMAAPDLRNE